MAPTIQTWKKGVIGGGQDTGTKSTGGWKKATPNAEPGDKSEFKLGEERTPAVFAGPITFSQVELPADGKSTVQGVAKWTPPTLVPSNGALSVMIMVVPSQTQGR